MAAQSHPDDVLHVTHLLVSQTRRAPIILRATYAEVREVLLRSERQQGEQGLDDGVVIPGNRARNTAKSKREHELEDDGGAVAMALRVR